MNLKCKLILEDYRKQKDDFLKLGDVVRGLLSDIIKRLDLSALAVEHRVKEENSLIGKLERKGEGYSSIKDITDILGCRIICYLSDEVDMVCKEVEKTFEIDWANSADKKMQFNPDAFGYLSVHYICSLPSDKGYPTELCGKKFELQIRTILQHAWAVIQHDVGYKTDFGVPRNISRQFARLAGLLELADNEFIRARDGMTNYTEEIRERIIANQADDVNINMISLREYVTHNELIKKITDDIAKISNAEIQEIDSESYVEQLAFLGIKTLGDINRFIVENHQLALKLAQNVFDNADLDIVSSNVSLRFLCRAELISKNYSYEKIVEFLKLSLYSTEKAQRQAKHLLKQKESVYV